MRGYVARLLLLALVLLGVPLLMAQVPRGGTSGAVRKLTCTMVIGAENGAVLVDADLGPQGRQCFLNAAGTLLEVTWSADAGTPSILPRRNRGGSTVNILSGALSTAASGGLACSNTGGTICLDSVTTGSATLQNTSLNAGDWLELVSGSASTAKRVSLSITWSVP